MTTSPRRGHGFFLCLGKGTSCTRTPKQSLSTWRNSCALTWGRSWLWPICWRWILEAFVGVGFWRLFAFLLPTNKTMFRTLRFLRSLFVAQKTHPFLGHTWATPGPNRGRSTERPNRSTERDARGSTDQRSLENRPHDGGKWWQHRTYQVHQKHQKSHIKRKVIWTSITCNERIFEHELQCYKHLLRQTDSMCHESHESWQEPG